VERDVLVCLFAAGSAIRLPDVHPLAVADERGEPLPQAVDQLTYAQGELPQHVMASFAVGDESGAALAYGGQHPAVGGELQAPLPGGVHAKRQFACAQLHHVAVLAYLAGARLRAGQHELRSAAHRTGLVVARAPITPSAGDQHSTVSSGLLGVSPRPRPRTCFTGA
jgi:hypothetical protein